MFEVGNVVYLKSDRNMRMTISVINSMDSNLITCLWFNGAELKSGNFPAGTLKKINEPN